VLIAAGRSIKDAAAEVECGERTAHTWLADPGYRALIAELRHRMLDGAVGRLADATNAAVSTLRDLLGDDNGNTRLRAATTILDAVVRLREHVEIDARILRLEQDAATEAAGPARRIVIPTVDERWHRSPPPQAQDGETRGTA
jgi:hypothetical protein